MLRHADGGRSGPEDGEPTLSVINRAQRVIKRLRDVINRFRDVTLVSAM
mgnify:FL=1